MAVVAALRVAEREGPDAVVVVLLPDGGRGYMAKIFNDEWMSSYGFLRTPLDAKATEPLVGDVLRGKTGALPDLVHTHPSETPPTPSRSSVNTGCRRCRSSVPSRR